MKSKRLLALLLAMGMVMTAAAGCGNSESAGTGSEGTATADDASDDGDSANEDADDEEDDEDITDITVALMSLMTIDASASDAVEEAINEITESEIGVHVDIQWYDGGTYGSQVPMMIQGGDDLDLMMFTPVPGASYTSFLGANQLKDITDLLDEYGQDIKDIQGDLINGCTLNGRIYGVGNYGDKAASQHIALIKSTLEAVDRVEDAENATSWSDVEDILKDVVAAGYVGMVNNDAQGTVLSPNCFMNGSDDFSGNYATDILGDGYLLVATDAETDTVSCKYFTDDFAKMVERTSNWYQEGLIYADAATSQEYGSSLLKSLGTGLVSQAESGSKGTMEAILGEEVVTIQVCNKEITTESCTKFGYGIPVTAKEPEAAMKFLNLLYTSEDIMNTLTWGVEGRDWVMGDDGYATYPDGVTAETVLYHTSDFLYGNQFITAAWEGASVSREEQKQLTDECGISKYFGFQLDNTGLENTVTACYNVEQQYLAQLMSGSVGANWESTLAEFQEKLKAAGIDDLIVSYQQQLDDWLAQQ